MILFVGRYDDPIIACNAKEVDKAIKHKCKGKSLKYLAKQMLCAIDTKNGVVVKELEDVKFTSLP